MCETRLEIEMNNTIFYFSALSARLSVDKNNRNSTHRISRSATLRAAAASKLNRNFAKRVSHTTAAAASESPAAKNAFESRKEENYH